jgi:hypothetical protein
MKSGILVTIMLSCVLVGCTQPGMNAKLATADAGCGLAVVGALEATPDEKFDDTRAKIVNICTELLGFVETGSLAQLPLDEVKAKLDKFMIDKGWGQYTYLVDTVVQWVKTQNVNVEKIGTNNVYLIKVGLKETIRNAERCTVEGKTRKK